jgi:LysM repeat protein
MKSRILLMVCLLAGGLFISNIQPTSATSQVGKKGSANEVISLVNQLRAARGLPAYQVNNALMVSAQQHSDYQASIGSITHDGAGGSRPLDRAVAAGYGGGLKVYISENIYGGNDASAQTAVSYWQGDSLHMNTMISTSYTDVGVGIAVSGSRVYYTMDAGYVSGSPGSGNTSSSGGGSSSNKAATSGPTVVAIVPIQIATPQADGSIVHVVQQGQALWNIAAAYKINLDDLLMLNGLSNTSFIHPGDKIIVRKATTDQETTTGVEITSTLEIFATQDIHIELGQTEVAQAVPNEITQAVITSTEQSQQEELVAGAGEKMSANEGGSDLILLVIVGLVVLGTSLILIGSMGKQRGSGN